jgi:hypothetical protein
MRKSGKPDLRWIASAIHRFRPALMTIATRPSWAETPVIYTRR